MPLTAKGSKVMKNMQQEYGDKKGESVFYASKNKGTISGVESAHRATMERFVSNFVRRARARKG